MWILYVDGEEKTRQAMPYIEKDGYIVASTGFFVKAERATIAFIEAETE